MENCVNCNRVFEIPSYSKFHTINIIAPVVEPEPHPFLFTPVRPVVSNVCQVLQQLSVKKVLQDVYRLSFPNLAADAQLCVCHSCSLTLANLYVAHQNFSKTRDPKSIIAEALDPIKGEVLEGRTEIVTSAENKSVHPVPDEVGETLLKILEKQASGCSDENGFFADDRDDDVFSEIFPKRLIPSEKSVKQPRSTLAVSSSSNNMFSADENSNNNNSSIENSSHENVINIVENSAAVEAEGVSKKLPTPLSGVKVQVFKNVPTNYCSVPAGGPPYNCRHCGKISQNANSYRNHMSTNHRDLKTKKLDKNEFSCGLCNNLKFQSHDHLRQHQLLTHEFTGAGRGLFPSNELLSLRELANSEILQLNSLSSSVQEYSFTETFQGSASGSALLKLKLSPGVCAHPSCHFLAVTTDEAVEHYISLHSRCEEDIEQARRLGIGQIQFEFQDKSIPPEILARFTPTTPPPYHCQFCDFVVDDPDKLKEFTEHLKFLHYAILLNFAQRLEFIEQNYSGGNVLNQLQQNVSGNTLKTRQNGQNLENLKKSSTNYGNSDELDCLRQDANSEDHNGSKNFENQLGDNNLENQNGDQNLEDQIGDQSLENHNGDQNWKNQDGDNILEIQNCGENLDNQNGDRNLEVEAAGNSESQLLQNVNYGLAQNLPATFSIVFTSQTFQFTLPNNNCPYCAKAILCKNNWNQMKSHIRNKHLWNLENKIYKCPKCQKKTFNKYSSLSSHKRNCGRLDLRKCREVGRAKNYCCEKCGKSFINQGVLNNHQTSRCGQTFTCKVCGQSFSKNYKLTSHMIRHTTERPFFCERCGRNYKSKHGLSFHQKISHSEEGRLEYNRMMRMKNKRRKLKRIQQQQKEEEEEREIFLSK